LLGHFDDSSIWIYPPTGRRINFSWADLNYE
jgi:hypothetical protein